MTIWGFDGRIQRANPAWEPVLGFTAAEMEGLLLFDLVHPEDRAAAAAEFGKALRSRGNSRVSNAALDVRTVPTVGFC